MSQIKMPPVPLTAPAGESSADRISPQVVRAGCTETAEVIHQRIRQQRLSSWDLVCVIDGDGRLMGTLTAQQLLALPDATTLGMATVRDGPTVLPGADQELMASMALHHRVATMPVVDEAGRLVGVVGPTTLMDILRREHVEDL